MKKKAESRRTWFRKLCVSCKCAVNPKYKVKIKQFRPNWDKKDGYAFPADLPNEWYLEQYPEIYKENI